MHSILMFSNSHPIICEWHLHMFRGQVVTLKTYVYIKGIDTCHFVFTLTLFLIYCILSRFIQCITANIFNDCQCAPLFTEKNNVLDSDS